MTDNESEQNAERVACFYINRYGPTGEGVVVADRKTREAAEQVATIFQQASDAKGEGLTYKVEPFKAEHSDGKE